MKIIVFSLGVVFQNRVQGGSQKALRDISIGLGNRGHDITILCPKRDDNNEKFRFSDRVIVNPVLPLKGSFPMPYSVSPFDLTETYRIIEENLIGADLFYCHDGGINIEFVKRKVPTIISLRDFCYTETLLGALNFEQQAIIVNSDYTYKCLEDSFMQVNPNIRGKVYTIYNGYDSKHFKRKIITDKFYDKTQLPIKKEQIIIGFPHRPDIEKGFENALFVIDKLRVKYKNIKLLIPFYMDQGLSERTDATYNKINQIVKDKQLDNYVIFHNWISHQDMPEYYSYCDLILCIGHFVEAFSNVSIESLLCGTPVIAANLATYRTMPIADYIEIVDYGDIEGTIEVIEKLIWGNQDDKLIKAREQIEKNLSMERCISNFEGIFKSVLKDANNFDCDYNENTSKLGYRLSSWCFYVGELIYDDYLHTYHKENFNGLFQGGQVILTEKELVQNGIALDRIEKAVKQGLLLTADK